MRAVALAVVLCCTVGAANADEAAAFKPPPLEGYVVDAANVLGGADWLSHNLKKFRQNTSYALVVFTYPSLGSTAIEDAAYKAFNSWKIGDEGKDNGVLLMIATVDRKVKIETGKGVGHILTDLQSSDIIAKMAPKLKEGDFASAVDVGIKAMEALFVKEAIRPPPKVPFYKKWWFWLLVGFGGVSGIIALVTHLSPGANRKLGVVGKTARGIWMVFPLAGKIVGFATSTKNKDKDGDGGGTSGGGGATRSY